MTNDLMVTWLKKCLIPSLPADRGPHRRALVIMDGVSFHYGFEFVQECKAAHIEIMLRYPHGTRDNQGEDRINYRIFKPAYDDALWSRMGTRGVNAILQDKHARSSDPIGEMAEALCAAFAEGFSTAKNLAAWQVTGFCPFTRSVMWEIKADADRRQGVLHKAQFSPPGALEYLSTMGKVDDVLAEPLSGLTAEQVAEQDRHFDASTLWTTAGLTGPQAQLLLESNRRRQAAKNLAKIASATRKRDKAAALAASSAILWRDMCQAKTKISGMTMVQLKAVLKILRTEVPAACKKADLLIAAQSSLAKTNFLDAEGCLKEAAADAVPPPAPASAVTPEHQAGEAPTDNQDDEEHESSSDDDSSDSSNSSDDDDDDGDDDDDEPSALPMAAPARSLSRPLPAPVKARLHAFQTQQAPAIDLKNRMSVMRWLVHQVLWVAKADQVYGGYVRDAIVCNTEANDIDVAVSNSTHLARVKLAFTNAALSAGFVVSGARKKGHATCVTVSHLSHPWKAIEVDLVIAAKMPAVPGVDSTTDNLAPNNRGELVSKVKGDSNAGQAKK